MRILVLIVLIATSSVVWGADCPDSVDSVLKSPVGRVTMSKTDRDRLSAIVRSHAKNILQGDVREKSHLKYHSPSNLFSAEYTAAGGDAVVDIIFDEHAIIFAYRTTIENQRNYRCMSERLLNSVKKATNGKKSRS